MELSSPWGQCIYLLYRVRNMIFDRERRSNFVDFVALIPLLVLLVLFAIVIARGLGLHSNIVLLTVSKTLGTKKGFIINFCYWSYMALCMAARNFVMPSIYLLCYGKVHRVGMLIILKPCCLQKFASRIFYHQNYHRLSEKVDLGILLLITLLAYFGILF